MSGAGEGSRRTRDLLLWSGAGVLLVLAFVAALGAVQRTYYSATGFVTAYMQTLAAHDVAGALSMPGAAPSTAALNDAGLPTGASRELLRSDVLPTLTDIEAISDQSLDDGRHRVRVNARADGRPVTGVFTVEPAGSVLGVLPTWRFATTPLTVARITVAHADDFTIGRHTLQPRAAAPDQPADAFSAAADYLMFAPARYELGHSSRYLKAEPTVVTGKPGATVEATVDAEPTPAFLKAVQKQLDAFLDDCATQDVLQPAGCPFGVEINDRVQGAPAWSIAEYPPVTLQAGPTSWLMPQTPGVAHLTVTVQSLFDGTVEERSSDERFTVALSSVRIRQDGSLDIVVSQ